MGCEQGQPEAGLNRVAQTKGGHFPGDLPPLWPPVRHMVTGQTGHSSPDAALSRQARQWALSFRTPPSDPTPSLECTTRT